MTKWASMYPTSVWLGFGPGPRGPQGYSTPERDPQPPDECPRCDGAGCILCVDDPGGKADWEYDTQKDREQNG